MSASSLADNVVQQRLDAVLQRLTEQVRFRIPNVQCRIHHRSNDHFAWWVVARLSNPSDENKIVDISIECKSMESQMNIHADLAREDGTVLQEFVGVETGVQHAANNNGAVLEDALREVERFLLEQERCLIGQLA